MVIYSLRDVFGFQYTLRGHVALLVALFAVFLAQAVIAVVADTQSLKIYFAVGVVIPPVAIIFILFRMYLQPFEWFLYSSFITLLIEFGACVLLLLIKFAAIGIFWLSILFLKSDWGLSSTLLSACTVLELLLYVVLECKLANTLDQLSHLNNVPPAEINRMLRELRGRRDVGRPVAGAGVVPNGHVRAD